MKRSFRNLSIPKTFMVYMLLFVLLAAVLSACVIQMASNIESSINARYGYADDQYTLHSNEGEVLIVTTLTADYSARDSRAIMVCHVTQVWSIPLLFGVCIVAAALLFYRNKLKRPIMLLKRASEKIAGNNLDFSIRYDRSDEMGQLCASFETMRAALLQNNRTLWRTAEERKRLNAAFSHDLRTPLTVLKGYVDLLADVAPQNRLDQQQTASALSAMSGQVARLEKYVQTMSEAQRVEDIQLTPSPVQTAAFMEAFRNAITTLANEAGRKLDFQGVISADSLTLDVAVVSRVLDNLIANAVRYARNSITVQCSYEHKMLTVTVADDGSGFTEEALQKACLPYFTSENAAGGGHVGIGLYVSKALCQKHGGELQIRNNKTGGASVVSSFFCGRAGQV